MTSAARVSVIIPAYNAVKFLPEAIRSVLAQSHPVSELIVVNDGSVDGTAALLDGYSGDQFRILNVPNGGVSRARNLGLEVATGDFIAFLDADDTWHEDKVAAQIALMEEAPEVGFCFTDSLEMDDHTEATYFNSYVPELHSLPLRTLNSGYAVEGDTLSAMLSCRLTPFWTSVVMVRRSALGDIRFPPEVKLCEDFVYFVRCFLHGNAGFVRRPLMSKRRHDSNSVTDPSEFLKPQVDAINLLLREPLTSYHRKLLRRQRGRALAALGHAQFWRGDYGGSSCSYLQALTTRDVWKTSFAHLLVMPFQFIRTRIAMQGKKGVP